ncbi:disease resistance protein, partial [Tanacetum coccineum]
AALAAIQETLANIQAEVRTHTTEIANLKMGEGTSVNSYGRKVQLASMHMFDAALVWYQQHVKKYIDNTPWEHFEVEVVKRFGVLYDDPIVELKNLKQTGLVQTYQEAFEALLARMQEAINTILKPRYNTPLLPTPKQSTTTYASKAVTTPVKSNLGHKCSGQLHSIEVICEGDFENHIDGDDVTYEDSVGDMVEVTDSPQITLNALSGLNSYKTMRIMGRIAKKLGCRLTKTTPMQVSVANGQKMMSTS